MGRRVFGFLGGALLGYLTAGAGNVLLPTLLGGLNGLLGASQHINGPRLNDLGVTVSEEGQPLPKIFGEVRVGMSLIWSSGLVDHTQEGGGSGFGQPSVDTVVYSTNLYYIGGVGRITELRRLWFNQVLYFALNPADPSNPPGNIVVEYDAPTHTWNPPASPSSRQSVFLTIYGGGDTQLPWAPMEAVKGVGKTPAYLNRWGIGIDNIGMESNNPPNCTAEVYSDVVAVSDIILWCGAQVGLTSDYFDLHELEGLSIQDGSGVGGYIIGSRQQAAAAVQQLQARYNFTMPEVDCVFRARVKGNASMASLSMADLEQRLPQSPPAPTAGKQADELQIPQITEVQYYDPDRKYHPGYRYGRLDSTIGKRKESINFTIAMKGAQAERLAKIRVHENRMKARLYGPLQMGYAGLMRAAGDDITIPTTQGDALVHLTDTDAQLFGLVSANAHAYDPAIYDAPIPLDTGGLTDPVEGNVGSHTYVLIETNSVRDELNANLGFYFGFTVPFGQTYTPGYLTVPNSLVHPTGGFFGTLPNQMNFVHRATIGTVEGVILDNPDIYSYTWDRTTTVTVRLVGGTDLSSAAESDILSGTRNGIICGREIIQFATATFVGTNSDGSKTWALTNLLRGRRGTEPWMSQHSDGEPCILIDQGCEFVPVVSTILRTSQAATVTADGYNTDINFELEGYNLYPYAPADVRGSRNGSGDLSVTFLNRTRNSDNYWMIGADNPDSEATPTAAWPNRYRLQVLDGGGTVLDTYYSNTLSFSIANADLPTVYSSDLTLSVPVQISESSSVVGWGYNSPIAEIAPE